MENNSPRAVKLIAFLNYAGALSALVILCSFFFSPAGSFLQFNDYLQTLFLGAAGAFFSIVAFGIGFFGGPVYLYIIPLVIYCVFLFILAEKLLQHRKWARIFQLISSIISIVFLLQNAALFFGIGDISLAVIGIVNLAISISIVIYLFSRKAKDLFANGPQKITNKLRVKLLSYAIIYILVVSLILYFVAIVYLQSPSYLNHRSEKHAKPNQEMVMTKGMEITAQMPQGIVKIKAPDSYTRTYFWDNCMRAQILWPRGERWYGSFGAYFAGPNPSWKNCNGVTGSLLEEGQMHFQTENEAMRWINSSFGKDHAEIVYNNQGLLVFFSKGADTVEAQVWQLFINGAKPTKLPGADDGKISVKSLRVL